MAKQTVKAAKAETPDAVKAKGAKPVELTSTALTMPSAKALSNVGLRVVQLWMTAEEGSMVAEERKKEVREREEGAQRDRYEAAQLVVSAIIKAVHAGVNIPLQYAFDGNRGDVGKMLDQVKLITGMAYIAQNKKGQPVVVETPEIAALITEQPGDDARTLARKTSVRTNAATKLKKLCQAAQGILDDPKMKVEIDKADKTLRLTGPSVKDTFGATSVVLNEKQSVQPVDKKGQPTGAAIKLKKRPSFQALADKAAAARGKNIERKGTHTVHVDPMKGLIELCSNMTKAIAKAVEVSKGELPDDAVKALEGLQSAIRNAIE